MKTFNKLYLKNLRISFFVGMFYEIESRRLKNSIAEHIIYGWQEDCHNQQQTTLMPFEQKEDSFAPF